VLGEAQRVAGQQQPAQQPLALAERQGPYVAAVGPQQVEHIQVHRYLSAQRRPGINDPEPTLQPGKLVRSPSKATISMSTMKSLASWARSASAISGWVLVTCCWLRIISRSCWPAPHFLAAARTVTFKNPAASRS